MKNILSLWLSQTLLILFLKYITICYAVDLSESDNFGRSNYEESKSNNRRRYYGDPDDVSRANQYYETATDGERRISQQNYLDRSGDATKFTKPASHRKPQYSESRKAYAAALGYSNTRNGDTDEIDSAMPGASSAENGDSNGSIIHEGGLANNTAFASVSSIVKSNFPIQSQLLGKTDSCTCQGAANEEVSFLCFSSRDGKNLSIKYKGTTLFDIEDILKGYKYYFDNMQVYNFNIEKLLNSESNFKHEFEGDSKLDVDISKYQINEGNFNVNAESKFDINKIKKGDSKFNVNTFGKFDVNTIKDDSNKFNFEITKNGGLDLQKYFNDNNNFKFEKNTNSDSKIEAWKKIQEMAESKPNNKFSLNNNFNSNQFTYEADVQVDAQAELEAHAKALAEAKAKAKVQAVLQNQIVAQAQIEAEAKAKAQAEAQAKTQMQINGIGQTQINSQSHAISFSDGNNGHINNFGSLGVGGEKKIFGNGGFSLGYNGLSNFGTSYGKQTGGAFSFGGGSGGAIGIGGGAGGAIGIGGGAGGAFGIGGGAGGAIGIGGGAGGAIGIGGGAGGAIGIGGGAGGAFGIGGRVPFTGKSMGGNDGQGMGTVITYTGSEFNYGDDLYDDSLDDGSLPVGYTGVLAFPTSNDGSRLYNTGHFQKDGYTAFGVSGYQRYP